MAKFCPSCGAEVKEGTVFCDKCGAEVDAENPTGQNQIQHTPQPEISRTTEMVLGIIGGVFGILGAIFAIVFSAFGGDEIFENTENMIKEFGTKMIERGIKPELECFDKSMIEMALRDMLELIFH